MRPCLCLYVYAMAMSLFLSAIVFVYVYAYVYMSMLCLCLCVSVFVYAIVYVHVHVRVHVYANVNVHVYAKVFVHVYANVYVHVHVHPCHDHSSMMADETRAPEGSVNSASFSHEGASRVTSFPLEVDRSRNRTKFKWLGSFELLRTFALDHLKLMGSWSFTSNNGGFHFLKSECVTLSFYPNTKTLNVQGMKEKEMRDKILSLAPEETGEFVPLIDDNVIGP